MFISRWFQRVVSLFGKGREQKRLCEIRLEYTDHPIVVHVIKIRDEASAAELAMSLTALQLLLKCFEIRVESADEFPDFL